MKKVGIIAGFAAAAAAGFTGSVLSGDLSQRV